MEEQILRCYHPNTSLNAYRTVQHNVRKGGRGKRVRQARSLLGLTILFCPLFFQNLLLILHQFSKM
jgi:hypothetical protein